MRMPAHHADCRLPALPHVSMSCVAVEALARIGPVLCLYPQPRGSELMAWRDACAIRAESCVDFDGVRESLRMLDAQGQSCVRLFLLPDSEYSAWQAVRECLPCIASEVRATACGPCAWLRQCMEGLRGGSGWRSSLLQVLPGCDERAARLGWVAVSAIGMQIARRIALAEGVPPPQGV